MPNVTGLAGLVLSSITVMTLFVSWSSAMPNGEVPSSVPVGVKNVSLFQVAVAVLVPAYSGVAPAVQLYGNVLVPATHFPSTSVAFGTIRPPVLSTVQVQPASVTSTTLVNVTSCHRFGLDTVIVPANVRPESVYPSGVTFTL